MNAASDMKSQDKKTFSLKDLTTIVVLLLIPAIGIVFVWTIVRWSLILKIVVTILAAIYIPIQIIFILLYITMGNALFPQNVSAAQKFLEDRNGKTYVVEASDRNSSGLGSATFESVTLHEEGNESVKYYVYRCISRCDSSSSYSRDFRVSTYNSK